MGAQNDFSSGLTPDQKRVKRQEVTCLHFPYLCLMLGFQGGLGVN